MVDARRKFEAILASKGRPVPDWDGKRYMSENVQKYWRWFYLGWTCKGSK